MKSPACASAVNSSRSLERAVVMGAGLGVRVNENRTRPELLRARAPEVDGRRAQHARRLRRIGVEAIARDHPDTLGTPVARFPRHPGCPG
jgi:hypothetical protein